MSLTVQGNIAASISQRALMRSQAAMERALLKLSTGQNAPSARDDAAGLAVSSRIRGEIASLRTYMQNAQQATSLLQVAEGAYQRAEDMLNRMRALASQAQSNNLSNTERGMLDTEYQQIKSEMSRLAVSTTFGGNSVFNGGNISLASGVTYNPTDITSGADYDFADINGDGKADMITTSNTLGGVRVFLGRGDGTFNTTSDYALSMGLGASVSQTLTADFNGDGRTDIMAYGTNGSVVMINNGDGTFTQGATVTGTVNTITLGDFNGDGKMDYAFNATTSVTIAYNDGNGLSFTKSSFTVGLTGASIVAADFNNDGRTDLALSSVSGQATIYTNNGSGSFSTAGVGGTFGTSNRFGSVADVDKDGLIDYLVGDNAGNLWYLKNNGNGTFATATSIGMSATLNRYNFAADLNGDGNIDLVTTSSTNSFTFRQGTGGFNFNSSQSGSVGASQNDIIARDLNNDGLLDIIARTNTGLVVFMNTSNVGQNGSFRVSSSVASSDNVGYRIGSMSLNVLDQKLGESMITSIGTAIRAEESIKRAMQSLTLFRTNVAAATNRLDAVKTNIDNIIESQEGARSSIADLNVAEEMSNYIAQKLAVQAGISMLTQANKSQSNIALLIKMLG